MTFSSCNPATGVRFYSRPAWTPAQLDASIAALRAVQPAWRRLPVAERGHALRALSQQLLAHADELAGLISSEVGKLLAECRAEVEKSPSCATTTPTWPRAAGHPGNPHPGQPFWRQL